MLAGSASIGGTIVKAAPTFMPQTIASMMQLREVLSISPDVATGWQRQSSYMLRPVDKSLQGR